MVAASAFESFFSHPPPVPGSRGIFRDSRVRSHWRLPPQTPRGRAQTPVGSHVSCSPPVTPCPSPRFELPPRKRTRPMPRPAVTEGGVASNSADDTPTARATASAGAGVYARAEQPAAERVDVEVLDEAPSSRVGGKRVAHKPRLGRDDVDRMCEATKD
jgi:hypothetical protein